MDSSELRSQLESLHTDSYGWALSCCRRNPSEAEAVLQTAYLKVLEGKARFDERSSFKTWLFSVIRNTAVDFSRRAALSRFGLARYERDYAALHRQEPPDDALYRSQIQKAFQIALADLPERQRQVLQLVFYHDLSLTEAADAMGVSVGSARTHYDRGKKRMRLLMAKIGQVVTEEELPKAVEY